MKLRSVRVYDKDFKLNAVALYKNGKSVTQICNELGLPDSTLWGWIKAFEQEGDKSFPGSGKIKASNEELYLLKKELEDARLERDILKKALAIFSKQK